MKYTVRRGAFQINVFTEAGALAAQFNAGPAGAEALDRFIAGCSASKTITVYDETHNQTLVGDLGAMIAEDMAKQW